MGIIRISKYLQLEETSPKCIIGLTSCVCSEVAIKNDTFGIDYLFCVFEKKN